MKDRVRQDIGARTSLQDWTTIDWKAVKKWVKNLRQRIYRATQQAQWNRVRILTKLMLRSYANLLLSIRRMTQENRGKQTAGLDGQIVRTSAERVALVKQMQAYTLWRIQPTKRVYIPKANNKVRPLRIPCITDRVAQTMVKNALEPSWEARLEAHAYGFRPGRGCHDAIEQCFSRLRRGGDTWILDADLQGAFDNLSHQFILDTIGLVPGRELIKQVTPKTTPNIAETLQTVDSLRLAELQNFFGDNYVLVASENARDRLLADDPQTTIITSVVLQDRTALIVNPPKSDPTVVWVEGNTETLESLAAQFRSELTNFVPFKSYGASFGQKLYEKLILPIEPYLGDTQTLVFIQDSFLRNIPMSALHDGNRYLVEKYAIATTPSLSLTAPRAPKRDINVLAVGSNLDIVTESGRDFKELDLVDNELAAIADLLPDSKTLLNEEFTIESFKTALKETRYSILHLATHGQFSTVPEETFVITGPNAEKADKAEEITFEQLEALISDSSTNNEPLDLITLTACQTATGDDRATLGLAGVAIQSGARSAIASLWNLNDKAAATFSSQFYSYLQDPNISKAQALQKAQIDLINGEPDGHPGKWAPLVLVGNWQ